MTKAPKTFTHLETIVEAMRLPAKRLAVSVGNFHGTDKFAARELPLWEGFVLTNLQDDLIAITVVRAYALLAESKWATDATLTGAAEILRVPGVQAEVLRRAQQWHFPNDSVAKARARRAPERLNSFLHVIDHLNIETMRDYRNWVLAHTTLNPAPPLTHLEVWEIADAALGAFDDLRFVVVGDYDDVAGLSRARREQAKHFWDSLYTGEE